MPCDGLVQRSEPTHRAFAVLALFFASADSIAQYSASPELRLTILFVRLVVAVVLFETTSSCALSRFFCTAVPSTVARDCELVVPLLAHRRLFAGGAIWM